MLRIVGVQRTHEPNEEFVLLQNQGVLKVNLKGHLIASENAFELDGSFSPDSVFAFSDDVIIPPKSFVMLVTGVGDDGWGRSKDGSLVYYKFWQKNRTVWDKDDCPVQVLGVLHSKPCHQNWAQVATESLAI